MPFFNRLSNPSPRQVAAVKVVLFVAALLPLVRLIAFAALDKLGANPVEFITRNTGDWTLYFLCLTLAVTPLRRTPMLAILPAGMKAPAAVTPAWLARHPLILEEPDTHIAQTVTAWFAAAGLRPNARIEVTINEITRQLVATGYGVSVLPFEHADETLGGRLQVRPLRPALVRRLGIAHRPREQLDAPVRRVLDTLLTFRDAK